MMEEEIEAAACENIKASSDLPLLEATPWRGFPEGVPPVWGASFFLPFFLAYWPKPEEEYIAGR